MARFLMIFLIVALVVFILGAYLPYWPLMIMVSIVSFLIGAKPVISFLSSGLAFGLTWIFLAIFISIQTNSGLPPQIASLMGIKNDSLLWFATGIMGFLLGGFS